MYLLKKHTPKNFFHFFFLEKMVCDNCLKFDKDCFEYKCNVFENRRAGCFFDKYSNEHTKIMGRILYV